MVRQHTDIIQIQFIGIALAVSFSHGLFPMTLPNLPTRQTKIDYKVDSISATLQVYP